MAKVTKKQVWTQLKEVIDPELEVDIVSLGLIYKVSVDDKVNILLTLTSPGCPLAGMFEPMIKEALAKIEVLDVDQDVFIELTFDPPWTPDMMSKEVKAELGFD